MSLTPNYVLLTQISTALSITSDFRNLSKSLWKILEEIGNAVLTASVCDHCKLFSLSCCYNGGSGGTAAGGHREKWKVVPRR